MNSIMSESKHCYRCDKDVTPEYKTIRRFAFFKFIGILLLVFIYGLSLFSSLKKPDIHIGNSFFNIYFPFLVLLTFLIIGIVLLVQGDQICNCPNCKKELKYFKDDKLSSTSYPKEDTQLGMLESKTRADNLWNGM